MKAKDPGFRRKPRKISGSGWRRIYEILTGSGQFSKRTLEKRAARRARKFQ